MLCRAFCPHSGLLENDAQVSLRRFPWQVPHRDSRRYPESFLRSAPIPGIGGIKGAGFGTCDSDSANGVPINKTTAQEFLFEGPDAFGARCHDAPSMSAAARSIPW